MSKTIYEMDFTDNFPDALCYDPKMVALGAIAAVELEEVNNEMKNAMIYERIDELPEKVLDVLAYDFNADLYDYTYPVETKRSIIKNCFKASRIKGTVYATELALQAVWAGSYVEEWFDYNGQPFHFRVVCDVTKSEVQADNQTIEHMIRKQKRLSAKLDETIFQCVISCRILTHADYAEYSAPVTGRLAAGTHPARRTRGGQAASLVTAGTKAEAFLYTATLAGTKPERSTLFREQESQIAAETEFKAFSYKTYATGQKKAGETPQRSTRGATDGGAVQTVIDAAGFAYKSRLCGSKRKL